MPIHPKWTDPEYWRWVALACRFARSTAYLRMRPPPERKEAPRSD